MANWSKKKIRERVAALDNATLYYDALEAGAGDDYDGCFTNEGGYEYDVLCRELNRRLVKIGFITDTDITFIV